MASGLVSEVSLGTAEPADTKAGDPSAGLLGRTGGDSKGGAGRHGGPGFLTVVEVGRWQREVALENLFRCSESRPFFPKRFSQLALSKCRTGCDWRWRGPPSVVGGRQAGRRRRRRMLTEAFPRDLEADAVPPAWAGRGGGGAAAAEELTEKPAAHRKGGRIGCLGERQTDTQTWARCQVQP